MVGWVKNETIKKIVNEILWSYLWFHNFRVGLHKSPISKILLIFITIKIILDDLNRGGLVEYLAILGENYETITRP